MLLGRAAIRGGLTYGEVLEDRFFPLEHGLFSADRTRSGPGVPLAEVRLLAPVTPRLVLLMVNAFLTKDAKLPRDEVPWMTPKLTTLIKGQDAALAVPDFAQGDLVAEAELAVVIGTEIHRASAAEAKKAIFGFTVFNDMTVGEIRPDMDMFRSKSVEGLASMGPWISTEITEKHVDAGLDITATVGDEIRVRGTTARYKFPVHEVIRFASLHTRLYPGDVISLGTPDACYVQRGDAVTLAVDGIGELRNRVVSEE